MVEPTDKFGVFSGEGVEWAVCESQRGAVRPRFVPLGFEGTGQSLEAKLDGAGRFRSGLGLPWCAGSTTKVPALGVRGLMESLLQGPTFSRSFDGQRQDVRHEVIAALRQGNRKLLVSATIQLRRSPGAWP